MFLLLNIFLWYLCIFIVLFIHEFGHALAARIVGLRVVALIIGYGKKLFSFEIFGIPVEVNLKPLNGLTYAIPADNSWIKTRMWLFNLGGLLTHIIVICVFLTFFWIDFVSFFSSLVRSVAILEVFFLANVFIFAINAFPYKISMPQGTYSSDGYNFFQMPFAKTEEILEMETIHKKFEAWNYLRSGDNEKAIELYEKLLSAAPDDILLKHDLAIAKLKFGNYEAARELLITLVDAEQFDNPQSKMMLYNNISWINAVIGQPDLLYEADEMSREAYNSNPKFINYIGTRGSVLVRLGKNAQGLEFLKSCYGNASSKSSRAETACFIAIGNANMGKFKEAAGWIEKARKNDSEVRLIEIAEKEINEALSVQEK